MADQERTSSESHVCAYVLKTPGGTQRGEQYLIGISRAGLASVSPLQSLAVRFSSSEHAAAVGAAFGLKVVAMKRKVARHV